MFVFVCRLIRFFMIGTSIDYHTGIIGWHRKAKFSGAELSILQSYHIYQFVFLLVAPVSAISYSSNKYGDSRAPNTQILFIFRILLFVFDSHMVTYGEELSI